jgi:hypothetical protein
LKLSIRHLANRWWARALAVWLLTRLVTTSLFLFAASVQGDNYWTKARPAYFDFLNIWDAEWFWRIFDHGYPSALPLGANGAVLQNEWAFMPVFPGLVRGISWLTGLEFKFAAPLVSTLASFVAAVLIYRLAERLTSPKTALWSVALIGLWCASPVLQVGYAESLGLVFLTWALQLVESRRYLAALGPIALLSFTRPGALAFALLFALLWLIRLIKARRDEHAFAVRDQLVLTAAASGSALLGFGWSLVAWAATGRTDAYVATELAWRAGYTQSDALVPFAGLFASANFHLGNPIGYFAVALVVLLATYLFSKPEVKALGETANLWMISYLLYLAAVFFPQSSTFRMLIPVFGLMIALAGPVSRSNLWAKLLTVSSLVALQLWWLLNCWLYTAPDFTPP